MCIPIEYTSGTCEDAALKKIDSYISLLEKNHISLDVVNSVREFRRNISTMFEEYYLGHQALAYCAFKKSLKCLMNDRLYIVDLPKESFYRARVNSNNKDFTNEEMFHIKYNLRGKVATQRFSFPGLPCLYLGASSYVCWLELNRPALNQFQVALIKQKKNTFCKVIDLSVHPQKLYNDMDQEYKEDMILSYLKWWPIIAMCSIIVKNENDPFKPEYIFPQYILQYLLEEKMDSEIMGIRYISIKAGKVSSEQYKDNYRTYTNYVFPITSEEPTAEGFCHRLCNNFAVIKNYSGKELEVLSDAIRRSGVVLKNNDKTPNIFASPLDGAGIYSSNGFSVPYNKTVFDRIEIVLNNKDNGRFSDDGALIIETISEDDICDMFK